MKNIIVSIIVLLGVGTGSFSENTLSATNPWLEKDRVADRIIPPRFPDKTYSVTDYRSDLTDKMITTAIRKAIEVCNREGGGTVVIPSGTHYTGPIELKSNVRLHLEEGAILKFSNNPDDYKPFVISRWEGWDCINFKPLIYAYKQTNIAITGKGILDGQADNNHWWPWKGKKEYGWKEGMISQEWHPAKQAGRNRLAAMCDANIPIKDRVMTEEDCLRPPFIQPYLCTNVLIEDIKIINAPFWLIHPLLSQNIIVRGVTMDSHGPNNDGCDPESCTDVLIENCYFNTGDDCIAIKSGRNNDGFRWGIPSKNIIIRNCIMKDGHGGVVIGSEISGGCYNVWAENCEMDSPELDRVVRIKSNAIRGGKIENLFVRNIKVGVCKEAVFRVEMKYERVYEGPNIPSVKNVILENITSNKSRYGIFIDGLEHSIQVQNVLIRNCNFNNVEIDKKITGAECVNFDNTFINGNRVIDSLPDETCNRIPAFPEAEGPGKYASGGRDGTVYFVNSLEDDETGNEALREGTLRWCLSRPGPKTILFKVAGTIRLKSKLTIPDNTTLAGQSAPGKGICIADNETQLTGNNIIIRYLRFRLGDKSGTTGDALTGKGCKNVIIDHCSMSWSTDECVSLYDNEDLTLQWCIISESLRKSVHTKGNHGYGGIWGGKNVAFHHNLLAAHDSRNPRMCGSRYSNRPDLEAVDFRNNVIYNWGINSGYGGEGGKYNLINNYYKPAPTSSYPNRIFQPNPDNGKNKQPEGVWGRFYVAGNYMDGHPEVTENNHLGIHPNPKSNTLSEILSPLEFGHWEITTQSPEEAFESVLAHGGASFRRDKTDSRIAEETRKGLTPEKSSGSTSKPGLIDSQEDVEGWESYDYDPNTLPDDNDRDGIPDQWLQQHYPGKKANDKNENGYTYLEVYLSNLLFNK